MISVENLRHFIAAVENRGINRAAEKIAISPSSLTRSIKGIEEHTGELLFDRIGRNLRLNCVGQAFYAKAKLVLEDFERLSSSQEKFRKLVGHYQIGASHYLCHTLVSKIMENIGRLYPDASFDVFSMDTSVLVRKLHKGDLDLGVGFSPKLSEAIGCERLSEGTMYLCAGEKHELANAPFNTLCKLLNQAPAIMHRATESVERCDNHPMFKKHGIRPRIQTYWDSDDVAAEMLATGKFWTMLPDIVIASRSGIVKLQHPPKWHAPYHVALLWNKQKTLGELKDAFLGAVRPH